MKIDSIEHVDDFEDEVVVYVQLSDPSEELEKQAKEIDGENYLPNCFGICYVKDVESGEMFSVTEFNDDIYYIDNDGEKHYLEMISDKFDKEVTDYITAELNNRKEW